ncbi:MFS transporter [Ilumatobacter sp.]|uniref:MFS transporter n=1 Tax=Ilumatobacter sp. TaxID=1967498 RepID=UPI003C597397
MSPDLVIPEPRERVWMVIALVMAATCVAQAFGRFTWGVVLPDARDDLLGGSNSLAGFFGTLNVAAYLVGTLAVSWASSRVTLVGLVRIGLVISTAALGLASIAPSGPVLALALIAMGIGGAVIWIPVPAIAARSLPPNRSGLAVGFVGSGVGLGIVFAGQMAGYLERRGDGASFWQTLYRIEFAIALVVLLGTFLFLRSQGDRPSGAGGFGGITALRSVRGWVPAVIAYAAFGFAYILVIGFLVARLEDDSGFSSSAAAHMFSLVGAATVIGGLSLGRLSDRIGRRFTLTSTFVVFGLCALLVLTGRQPWVAFAAFGIGLMFSGMPSLIIAHIVDNTTVDTYGPAFSAATLAFGVTQMISPQIGGAIADGLGSFTWVFVLSAAVSFIGAAFASRLPAEPPAASR